jgi:hypothetical protein
MIMFRQSGGFALAVSVKADVSAANVKRAHARGRSQNGQPVEFGHPLVVIA